MYVNVNVHMTHIYIFTFMHGICKQQIITLFTNYATQNPPPPQKKDVIFKLFQAKR